MKIINQYHDILEFPHHPLRLIEKAARNCYNSQDKIGCTNFDISCYIEPDERLTCKNNRCKEHSSHKLIKALIKKGHHSVLEFEDITVELVTNRGVMAELTRHRVGFSFAIQSTRYVKYNDVEFIKPVWLSDNLIGSYRVDWENMAVSYGQSVKDWSKEEYAYFWALAEAERKYSDLLSNGWRAEQAREVLPNALKTVIYMKGNYRAWRHLFELRLSKQAHPQFRKLLIPLFRELKKEIPVIFDDINCEGE
jgi:thymidylate synthase (FAD)